MLIITNSNPYTKQIPPPAFSMIPASNLSVRVIKSVNSCTSASFLSIP